MAQEKTDLGKIRVGIFFGGKSREREISFAGGRTVYDNLDKNLFEPVPIFIDSLGSFILLDWQFLYKGTIRDFYPPAAYYPPKTEAQLYIENLGPLNPEQQSDIAQEVGELVEASELKNYIDLAFLALHGNYGEDGSLQGLLDFYDIPYTGSGSLGSSIGIDKLLQKRLMKAFGLETVGFTSIKRQEWMKNEANRSSICQRIFSSFSSGFVVKSPRQGSSIGISVFTTTPGREALTEAIDNAFFVKRINVNAYKRKSKPERKAFISALCDPIQGLGLPAYAEGELLYGPDELKDFLEGFHGEYLLLESLQTEQEVLIEELIKGKEFSTIVIQHGDGEITALPPTEIRKFNEVFDYRSKYLPGKSRKITPIELPEEQIDAIRAKSEKMFELMGFQVYARIDGFITQHGEIYLNDPNTTSGMMPSSFFFHQAAEIGLDPSTFLTYIVLQSLSERAKEGSNYHFATSMLQHLQSSVAARNSEEHTKERVGVIMGGYSTERHISLESGRNIYEKLSSSEKYVPIPYFLTLESDFSYSLYRLPIHLLLKDNADDVRESVLHPKPIHPIVEGIRQETQSLTTFLTGNWNYQASKISLEELKEEVDEVFIALHGRPGEDGDLQTKLEKLGIPYNGSGSDSSQITINKYQTNELLGKHGISTARHRLLTQKEFQANPKRAIAEVEKEFGFPIIAKPMDDGCSSAVKVIKNQEELIAFAEMMFRAEEPLLPAQAATLNLAYNEEFPIKPEILIEELISKKDADHFLEITGGLLTHFDEKGTISYEIFEPTETLATGGVLSLEEKFLAGQGQNITPARFSTDPTIQEKISAKVRADLEKVARTLDVQGYARIDAFVRIWWGGPKVETIVIEINSLPGMTPATCIFHQTAINGYKPFDFIDKILEFGKKRTY